MLGIAFGLLSAVTWGLAGLVGTKATRLLGTNRCMAWSTIAGFAVVLVPALVTGPHSMPETKTLCGSRPARSGRCSASGR